MAVTASIVAGESYKARILRDTPLLYWPLNDASGLVALDSSPNGVNGAYPGSGVTYGLPGPLADGTLAVSPPAAGIGIQTFAASVKNLAGPFSFEAWVYLTVNVVFNVVFSNELANSYGFLVRFQSLVPFFRTSNAGGASQLTSTTVVPLNTWVHLVVTFDGTTNRIYLNGAQDCQAAAVAPVASTSGALLGPNPFNGRLCGTAIYPVALTARQVAEHYGMRLAVPSGLKVSGQALPTRHRTVVGSGGLKVGGAAVLRRSVHVTSTGGLRVSGTGRPTGRFVQHVAVVGSGGLRVGGSGQPLGLSTPRDADVIVQVSA